MNKQNEARIESMRQVLRAGADKYGFDLSEEEIDQTYPVDQKFLDSEYLNFAFTLTFAWIAPAKEIEGDQATGIRTHYYSVIIQYNPRVTPALMSLIEQEAQKNIVQWHNSQADADDQNPKVATFCYKASFKEGVEKDASSFEGMYST